MPTNQHKHLIACTLIHSTMSCGECICEETCEETEIRLGAYMHSIAHHISIRMHTYLVLYISYMHTPMHMCRPRSIVTSVPNAVTASASVSSTFHSSSNAAHTRSERKSSYVSHVGMSVWASARADVKHATPNATQQNRAHRLRLHIHEHCRMRIAPRQLTSSMTCTTFSSITPTRVMTCATAADALNVRIVAIHGIGACTIHVMRQVGHDDAAM